MVLKKTSRCSLDLVQNEGYAVKIIFKSCKHISRVYILATLRETLFESLCHNLASMAYCNGRKASPIMLWQRKSKHNTHPHLPSLQFVSNKAKIGMRNPVSLVLTTCLFIHNLSCSKKPSLNNCCCSVCQCCFCRLQDRLGPHESETNSGFKNNVWP